MAELEEKTFRRLLFLRHGCKGGALYGDDGEMQCSSCMIDFKRDSPTQIEQRFLDISIAKLAKKEAKLEELTKRALELPDEDRVWLIEEIFKSLEEEK